MKRFSLFLLLLSGSFFLTPVYAQVSEAGQKVRDWYDKETIYLLGNNKYVKNNTIFTGQYNLKKEFELSEGGMQLYLRSRRNRSIGAVISLTATVGSVVGLLSDNSGLRRTLFWSSLGLGLAGTAVNLQASNQLNQAVWLRNRDTLKWSDLQHQP
jgi:hypothetical protein